MQFKKFNISTEKNQFGSNKDEAIKSKNTKNKSIFENVVIKMGQQII